MDFVWKPSVETVLGCFSTFIVWCVYDHSQHWRLCTKIDKYEVCLWFPMAINTWTQLFMWSQAALAADIAELNFLAAITAAPRFWELDLFISLCFSQNIRGLWLTCTIGMNSFWIQASLLIRLTTDLPLIVAWKASGNWVVEILVHSGSSFFLTCTAIKDG